MFFINPEKTVVLSAATVKGVTRPLLIMQAGKRRHHLQFVLIKRKMIFLTGEITNDLMPLKRCFSTKWYSYIFSNDLSVFSDPTTYPPWGLPNIIQDCFCQYHWIEINIRKHPLEKSSQLLRFWLFWSIMHGSKAGFKHCSIEMLFSLEKIAAVCRSRRIIQSICRASQFSSLRLSANSKQWL